MKLENLKESLESVLDNVSESGRHLWQSATGAFTRFKSGETTDMPAASQVDDASYWSGRSWAMLGGDVFEDEQRLVVRLEVPGMAKEDIQIDVVDDALIISGEKRFERESQEGRWRTMQCAYGSFRRVVPLPVAVKAEGAVASYKNGVLRVEIPKAEPGKPKVISIKVQ